MLLIRNAIIHAFFMFFFIVRVETMLCSTDSQLIDQAYTLCKNSARCRESFFIETPSVSNSIVEATQKSYFENEFHAMLRETHVNTLAADTICIDQNTASNSVADVHLALVASQWLLVVMENHLVCPVNQFLNEQQLCVCRHDKVCVENADHVLLLGDVAYYIVSAVFALAALYYYSFLLNRVAQIDTGTMVNNSGGTLSDFLTLTATTPTTGNGGNDMSGGGGASGGADEESRKRHLQDYTELTRADTDNTIQQKFPTWQTFTIK